MFYVCFDKTVQILDSIPGFLSLAVLFDCGIWYYSKNLALYEEDEGNAANNNSTANIDGKEVNSCEGDVIALQPPST